MLNIAKEVQAILGMAATNVGLDRAALIASFPASHRSMAETMIGLMAIPCDDGKVVFVA